MFSFRWSFFYNISSDVSPFLNFLRTTVPVLSPLLSPLVPLTFSCREGVTTRPLSVQTRFDLFLFFWELTSPISKITLIISEELWTFVWKFLRICNMFFKTRYSFFLYSVLVYLFFPSLFRRDKRILYWQTRLLKLFRCFSENLDPLKSFQRSLF